MPIVATCECTQDSVLESLRERGPVSYETDNSEQLAVDLGFDRNQANLVFHYLRNLRHHEEVDRTISEVQPRRLQTRGSQPAILRKVTYKVIEPKKTKA